MQSSFESAILAHVIRVEARASTLLELVALVADKLGISDYASLMKHANLEIDKEETRLLSTLVGDDLEIETLRQILRGSSGDDGTPQDPNRKA